MTNKIVAVVVILFILLGFSLGDYLVEKSAIFTNENGNNIIIVEKYNILDSTMTVTIRVENEWNDAPVYYLFNPVVCKITNRDKKGEKMVEIPINFKDFVSYGSYHQATKTIPLPARVYKSLTRIEL